MSVENDWRGKWNDLSHIKKTELDLFKYGHASLLKDVKLYSMETLSYTRLRGVQIMDQPESWNTKFVWAWPICTNIGRENAPSAN